MHVWLIKTIEVGRELCQTVGRDLFQFQMVTFLVSDGNLFITVRSVSCTTS
jgi:hypothetical protein